MWQVLTQICLCFWRETLPRLYNYTSANASSWYAILYFKILFKPFNLFYCISVHKTLSLFRGVLCCFSLLYSTMFTHISSMYTSPSICIPLLLISIMSCSTFLCPVFFTKSFVVCLCLFFQFCSAGKCTSTFYPVSVPFL